MGDRPTEELIFDRFRKRYGLAGKFIHHTGTTSGDEGKPDFIRNDDGGSLGVEITEITADEKIYGKTLREHEAAKQRIVERAREKAVRSGVPPLRVCVQFQDDALTRGREAGLTDALYGAVKCRCPRPCDGEVELDGGNGVPTEFYKVYVHNYGAEEHDWDYIGLGDGRVEFSGQLQRIIAAKSKRLCAYLEHCQMCWLVIAALGYHPSSFYLISDQITETSYRSGFEKVFFLNMARDMMEELRVVRE